MTGARSPGAAPVGGRTNPREPVAVGVRGRAEGPPASVLRRVEAARRLGPEAPSRVRGRGVE